MFLIQRNGRQCWPGASLHSEMNKVFDNVLRDPLGALGEALDKETNWSPALDISENDEQVQVRLEVPGINPEQIDISIDGNDLVITGEKKETFEKSEKGFFHKESRYGKFTRKVMLPEGIDGEKVNANYTNGVLAIALPKTPAVAPRKISVNAKKE
jgi:HSP20 family protein